MVRCGSRRRSFALGMSSACLASVGEGFNSMNIRLAARPWRLDDCVHVVLQRDTLLLGVACNRVRVSQPRMCSMTLFLPCSFATGNATECSMSRHDCRSKVCHNALRVVRHHGDFSRHGCTVDAQLSQVPAVVPLAFDFPGAGAMIHDAPLPSISAWVIDVVQFSRWWHRSLRSGRMSRRG